MKYTQPSFELDQRIYDKYESQVSLPPHIEDNFFSESLDLLAPLLELHPKWNFKRIDYGHWEVRWSDKEGCFTTAQTLPVAICLALLEME